MGRPHTSAEGRLALRLVIEKLPPLWMAVRLMTRGWSMRRTSGVLIRGLVRSTVRFSRVRSGAAAGASAGLLGLAGLPATQDQQRPALHLAASVSHGRTDRICASEIGAPPVKQLALAAAPVEPMSTPPEPDRRVDGIIEVELPSGVKLRLTARLTRRHCARSCGDSNQATAGGAASRSRCS